MSQNQPVIILYLVTSDTCEKLLVCFGELCKFAYLNSSLSLESLAVAIFVTIIILFLIVF